MISMDKKYTFNGEKMVILTVTRPKDNIYPVIAVSLTGRIYTFTKDGSTGVADNFIAPSGPKLIEVKPTKWVNLYQTARYYSTKDMADSCAGTGRIACLLFTEGDGI